MRWETSMKTSGVCTSKKKSFIFYICHSYIRWAKHKQDLKVVNADIPTGVLSGGLEGELFDVKVFSKRGPDDAIYDNNKDIRDRVSYIGTCL